MVKGNFNKRMKTNSHSTKNTLFIVGMVSSVMTMALFILTVFVFPRLFFHWSYNTPEFISLLVEQMEWYLGINELIASKLLVVILFIFAVIFGVIASAASNRLNAIQGSLPTPSSKPSIVQRTSSETRALIMKISFYIMLVVMVFVLLTWLLESLSIEKERIARITNQKIRGTIE